MLTLIVVGLQIRPNGGGLSQREGNSTNIKIPDKVPAIIRRKIARDLNLLIPFWAFVQQKMGFRSAKDRDLNFK